MNLGLGPHEWLGVGIVGGDESVDMGHQFLAVAERSARKGFGRQDREPDFDLIEPRCLGWREVEMDVRVALQPAVVPGFVSVEIVENDVDLATGMFGDDAVHEVEKFDPAAALVLAPADLACRHVESREQGRNACPISTSEIRVVVP